MADAIDDGLIKALEEVKERCFKAGGEANWAHDILSIVVPALESPTLSRHKAPQCPTCAATAPSENEFCSDGFHAEGPTYWPLSVAGDDVGLAERIATIIAFNRNKSNFEIARTILTALQVTEGDKS